MSGRGHPNWISSHTENIRGDEVSLPHPSPRSFLAPLPAPMVSFPQSHRKRGLQKTSRCSSCAVSWVWSACLMMMLRVLFLCSRLWQLKRERDRKRGLWRGLGCDSLVCCFLCAGMYTSSVCPARRNGREEINSAFQTQWYGPYYKPYSFFLQIVNNMMLECK